MIRTTLRAQDIVAGQPLPSLWKNFSAADLMAYGAATWDWQRVHYDFMRAKELGFPNVFVDGQNYGSIFSRHAMDFFGPKAFIKKMEMKYQTMVFVGETISGSGEVLEIQKVRHFVIVVISQILKKDDGHIVASCRAEIQLPA